MEGLDAQGTERASTATTTATTASRRRRPGGADRDAAGVAWRSWRAFRRVASRGAPGGGAVVRTVCVATSLVTRDTRQDLIVAPRVSPPAAGRRERGHPCARHSLVGRAPAKPPATGWESVAMGRTVAVIGGGISGLAAAWELSRPGTDVSVTVLEGSSDWAGSCGSRTVGGARIDVGAESVLARRPEALTLVEELGVAPLTTHPGPVGASIVSRGRRWPMPRGTVMGVPADPESVRGLLTDDEVERLRTRPSRPGRRRRLRGRPRGRPARSCCDRPPRRAAPRRRLRRPRPGDLRRAGRPGARGRRARGSVAARRGPRRGRVRSARTPGGSTRLRLARRRPRDAARAARARAGGRRCRRAPRRGGARPSSRRRRLGRVDRAHDRRRRGTLRRRRRRRPRGSGLPPAA